MARQTFIPYVHSDGKTWDYFYVDPKSGIIYFIKSHGGKKIKFSTREKNGVKAKRFANVEFGKRTGESQRHVRTLIKEELEAWEKIKESEGLAIHTMYAIKRCRKQLAEFWGDKLPSEINRDTFAEWVLWWAEHRPNLEMETQIKYFNNFCVYLHEKVVHGRPLLPSRIRFRDPKRHETLAARAKKKERILSPEEFQKIIDTAPGHLEALIVLFMYTMASRIEETLSLDFDRILLDPEIPVYRWTYGNNKAKRTGEHALHLSLIEPFKDLRAQRRSEGTKLLFPQKLNNQKPLREQMIDWAGWRSRAGIGFHWTPHTFRHTCLTNLFNDPRNPQATIIKQYRVSLQVALDTYVKVTRESMLVLRDSIKVSI